MVIALVTNARHGGSYEGLAPQKPEAAEGPIGDP